MLIIIIYLVNKFVFLKLGITAFRLAKFQNSNEVCKFWNFAKGMMCEVRVAVKRIIREAEAR